jgi:hypothetical protein
VSSLTTALARIYHQAMRSTPLLAEAVALDDHAVHVRFADGTTGDVDLGYLLDSAAEDHRSGRLPSKTR